MNEKSHGPAHANEGTSRRSHTRRLAEWISLGISVLLIAGLAVYLVYQGLRSKSPFVPVDVKIQIDRAEPRGQRFILPVIVTNNGEHTVRDVRVDITFHPPGQEPQQQDFTIDYLGQRAEQQIFVFVDHDPRNIDVKAEAVQYRLK